MTLIIQRAGMLKNTLILLLCWPLGLLAQKATFEFYDNLDGLAGKSIQSIVTDDKGLLWLTSERVLQRFDGRYFLTVSPPDRLPGVEKGLKFATTYQDSLLFLFNSSNAYLFHPNTNQWTTFSLSEAMGEGYELFQHFLLPSGNSAFYGQRLHNKQID
ncbi:MAG: hypothetical protein AAGJ93_05500, partial [Bacteroidota bacterium]